MTLVAWKNLTVYTPTSSVREMTVLPTILSIVANVTVDSQTESIKCLDNIMETYLKENCLLLISDSGVLNDLTAIADRPVVLFNDTELKFGKMLRDIRYDVVIYGLTNPAVLRDIIGKPWMNPEGKVVVATKNSSEKTARQIISILWDLKRITDVIVLTIGSAPIKVYCWFPYVQEECTNVKTLTLLDEYENGSFRRGANLFPVKISSDLNGCEVHASTRRIEPYVFDPEVPGYYVEGYEVRIMEELKSAYNIGLKYVEVTDPAAFYNSDKSSGLNSGVIKLLLTGETDIIFGGMMARQDRYEITEALYPHMTESFIWVYPKPGFKTNFYSIYITFSPDIWTLIILVHFFAAFTFYAAAKTRNRTAEVHYNTFSKCFFRSIAILCNNSVPQPNTKYLRFMVFSYIIYALHLCTAYQSYLIFLLTHSEREKPLRDIEKLVDRGMTAYLFASGHFWYNKSDHRTWNKIFRPGGVKYVDGLDLKIFLDDIAYNRSSFLLFPKSSIDYLTKTQYVDKGESVFEYLTYFSYPLVMYLSPRNPLRELFSKRIHALIQNGLFHQWRKIIIRNQAAAEKESYDMSQDAGNPQALSLKHLEGAFSLWFLALAASFIVFLGEILIYKMSGKPRSLMAAADCSNFPSRITY